MEFVIYNIHYKDLHNFIILELKRFEENDNKVILYFVELNNEPICVPFTITEHAIVENHVDAIVNLYDYYKPEYKVSTVCIYIYRVCVNLVPIRKLQFCENVLRQDQKEF